MKHRLDAPVRWHLQAIGQVANAFQDGEWSDELVRQLPVGAAGDGGLDVRLELEEDLFPNGEGTTRAILVRLLLETVLGVIQMASHHLRAHRPIEFAGHRVDGQFVGEGWQPPRLGSRPYCALKGEQQSKE